MGSGVPEDRADFTVTNWIKAVFKDYKPAPASPTEAPVNKKGDCYFDPECHKLVDWEKVGQMKMGVFGKLKKMKLAEEQGKDSSTLIEEKLKPVAAGVHSMLVKS